MNCEWENHRFNGGMKASLKNILSFHFFIYLLKKVSFDTI